MRQPLFLLCGLLALALAPALPAQEEDYSKVQIKSTALAPNLYVLQGVGGNIAAAVGAEGVLLVDDEFAGVADKIRAALQGLGAEQPVRFVVNTHYHSDHTDGNLAFAQAGAVVIAHDNLRTRLERGGMAGNGGSISKEFKPSPAGALPSGHLRERAHRAPERHAGAGAPLCAGAHRRGLGGVLPRRERGAHG